MEVSPFVVDEKILNDDVIFDAMIYDSGKLWTHLGDDCLFYSYAKENESFLIYNCCCAYVYHRVRGYLKP